MTPHPPTDSPSQPTPPAAAQTATETAHPAAPIGPDDHALTPIDPRYIWVIRAHFAINSLLLILLVGAGDYFLTPHLGWPQGVITGVITCLMLLLFLLLPVRRVASVRYHLADDHIRIRRGFLFTIDSIVPFVRVQHIDVGQGPIERALGLSSLSVHTSGVRNDAVTLPGLTSAAAHDMRDIIHRHILTDFE